jgi:hypothetical protein
MYPPRTQLGDSPRARGNPADSPSGRDCAVGEPNVVRGAKSVARGELTPGWDLEHYAWVNTTIHRNLYRISLP